MPTVTRADRLSSLLEMLVADGRIDVEHSASHFSVSAATIRRDLIAVAARTARHGRGHLTLHLPEGWHREQEWLSLLAAACGPPAAAA